MKYFMQGIRCLLYIQYLLGMLIMYSISGSKYDSITDMDYPLSSNSFIEDTGGRDIFRGALLIGLLMTVSILMVSARRMSQQWCSIGLAVGAVALFVCVR